MQEEWRFIENTNEEYEVSTLGNIRCISSGIPTTIRPLKDRCGYLRVKIMGRTYAVHRLVAMAFIPNPYNYPIVHHIDENKTNNTRTNLLWCTHQQNRIFAVPTASGKNARKKYKVLQLDMEGNIIAEWNTFAEAARSIGIKDSSVISKCAHHAKYRDSAYGYRWGLRYDDCNLALDELCREAFKLAPYETIMSLQKIIERNK